VNGQCLCGAVRFSGEIDRAGGVHVCHCRLCRRWSGGPFMGAGFSGAVAVEGDAPVWFRSSGHGERGHCAVCGTVLFWRSPGVAGGWVVNVHALDPGHGLAITEHIWTDEKPDFYDFADAAPRLTEAEWLARSAARGAQA
jgi:hypothetical protein